MSQRFIRCAHCGLPHDALQANCPSTGKAALRPKKAQPLGVPPVRVPPWPPPRRDLVGKTIGGRYVVRRVLGGGGMGTVFEAEHLTIGRSVAVKVLHPKHAREKEAVERFRREARAVGCISHPNVCEIYDLDTLDDGTPYLVMERLVGRTLGHRIAAERKLPLYDLVDILVQVLSALSAAHDKGIVHRDVKPDNVFLAWRSGCPPLAKLLDFGVSKAIKSRLDDGEVDLTRRGMVMGTPHYMSPEQARGDRDLDRRVDLYACGVMLYEAVTGHRPFVAESQGALLRQILCAKPRPPRELRRTLPTGFDDVLGKAMARNRVDRYQTAERVSTGPAIAARQRRNAPIAKVLRAGASQSARVLDGDDPPTHVWVGRLPDPSDDQDTVVKAPLPDPLRRAILLGRSTALRP